MAAAAAAAAAAWNAAQAAGFLVVAFLVYHVARLTQSKHAATHPGAARSPRARKGGFRGGVDGVRSNADWVVGELLTPGRPTPRSPDEGLPPEWERLYPQRANARDFDHAGTTVKLSTADMIGIRWDLPLNVSMELGLFADLIVRDFILFWYNESISQEPQFPDDVRSVLQNVLGRLGDRILSINLPMFLLCDISYVLRHHLRWFSELKKRARKRCHPESEFDAIAQEDRNKLVMEEFRRAGHLHPACSITGESNDPRTMSYVRSITSELLVRLLPEADFHCAALRHLVREVLTCNILVPTLESVTPDVLNNVILQVLRGELDDDNNDDEDDGKEENGEQGLEASEGELSASNAPRDAHDNVEGGSTGEYAASSYDPSSTVTTEASTSSSPSPSLVRDLRSGSILSTAESTHPSKSHSIDFIHETNAAMKQEEASRLLIELQGALSDCVSQFTQNADEPLGNDSAAARRLIEVLDGLLAHETHHHLVEDRAYVCVAEPWWDYVRKVTDIVPSTSMPTSAVDSVIDALALEADVELDASQRDEAPARPRTPSDAAAGASGDPSVTHDVDGATSSPEASERSPRRADATERSPRRTDASPTKRSAKGYSKEILAPGRAWLAMMLKHKLLAEAVQALLQDRAWTDSHYGKTAAIRAERLVPTLATLNGVDFDFDLNRFWKNAAKVRSKLERKGIKTTKQERLRRLRQRVRKTLVKRIKSHGSSVPDQAIVALQDRLGAIRSSVTGFTMRNSGRSSFVQYVLSLSLTRRVDGGVASWTVFRRYSKFRELHQTLRSRYGYQFDDVSLPKRGGLFSAQNMSFISTRKDELAAYLEKILEHPVVCDSEEILTFLSPQSAEDLEDSNDSMLPPPALDLSVAPTAASPPVASGPIAPSREATRLGTPQPDSTGSPVLSARGDPRAAAGPGASSSSTSTTPTTPERSPKAAAAAARAAARRPSASRNARSGEVKIDASELQVAEEHMYKLAQEIFEFHELSMLRRNLISMTRSVVSLVFQGPAQRWLRDNYTRDASAKLLSKLLATVRELLWPNGEFAEAEEEEGAQDPEKTRAEAELVEQHRIEALEEILGHIPQSMSKFLGKEKSHRCAKKLHEFLQHPTLIHNLLFTTMDLLLLRIFPDLPLKELHHKLR